MEVVIGSTQSGPIKRKKGSRGVMREIKTIQN